MLQRLRDALGLDFHVLATLFLRGWSIVAGGVMVIAIPLWFSQTEQGYYFTFASLLALQIFFELGINQVVVQIVAHESAHLQPELNGVLVGPDHHLDRLASLVRTVRRWYLTAAALFAIAVSSIGIYFFQQRHELSITHWVGAWLLLVAATAGNLFLSPSLAILEGCGRVGQVARIRLRQSILGYALMWVAMALGAGLWAVPIMPAVAAVSTAFWIRRDGSILRWLRERPVTSNTSKVSWRIEVLPFQWRIAVSWISGYFIFQLFTPLVFAHQGAVEAGRIGMALTVFNTLVSVGMSWTSAKIPVFSAHISRGERKLLNLLFFNVLTRSMAFTAFSSALFFIFVFIGERLGISLVHRVSPPSVLFFLGLVSVANAFVFTAAAYMRAHREEPMLAASVCTGLGVLAAVELGSRESVLLTAQLYTGVTLLISLPWTLLLLRRYLRRTSGATGQGRVSD